MVYSVKLVLQVVTTEI